VSVTGQGIVEAPADEASISLTVQNTARTLSQAQLDNKKEVQTLKDGLLRLGLPESQITQSASGYDNGILPMTPSIPTQDIPIPISQPDLILPPIDVKNPTATTTLSLTIDNLGGVDQILAAINKSPHAKVTSTYYSLKNTAKYDNQAREKAVQDARNQAESVAKINHLRVGKLLTLTNTYYPTPAYKEGVAMSGSQGSSGSQIAYGGKTITITASFNVQYELN
jgi:uncharacterized protein YggE